LRQLPPETALRQFPFIEESSGKYGPSLMTVNVSPPATGQSWVRPWWDRTLAPTTGAPSTRVGPRRKTGSILAPPSKPHPSGEIKDPSGTIHREANSTEPFERRRRTWTHNSTDGSVEECACC